ncbi:glycosyltransferase family 4 protein [Lacticaseibacillus kribbianus]|uniref:glycosyltransferase family 4 protein n=1 Tax=Lacticaseibacillus kribbianus TaxID=2926292 RepID=UPI001CD64E29|nr:glycosyltransferase family 4 protein [Lacticaseibacillus kribbianus]
MSKKRVCFLGQFPPPIHGLSKAIATLYNSDLNTQFEFSKLSLTNNRFFLLNLIRLLFSRSDLYYLTISQTKMGNLRDLILMGLILIKHKPCLIHLHGGYYRKLVDTDVDHWQRALNYALVKRLNGVIVLGESLKPLFMGMIDPLKIFVVENCVDDEYRMSDEELKCKLSCTSKRAQHILYLSNMIRSKGYHDVLELALLDRDRGSYVFDFAGAFFDKNEKIEFFKFIQDNKLESSVMYHGTVSGETKRTLLRKATFFILPTRYPKEGQPISILEAMGNGNVIITTNHAGIPDIVEDGVNGIVLQAGYSKERLLSRMSRVDFEKTAKVNFDTVSHNFSEERYVSKVLSIFSKQFT